MTATSPTEPLQLVLADGRRFPLDAPMTIGRGEEATVRIAEPTVSRMHARIRLGPEGPMIEDAGSRFGTSVSGAPVTTSTPLRPGAQIRVGDVVIGVEGTNRSGHDLGAAIKQEDASGPLETLVVPLDASTLEGDGVASPAAGETSLGPRVKPGWALKRLDARDGPQRFILRDLKTGSFFGMDPEDAALFELLDGTRTTVQLLEESKRQLGVAGPGRLVRLIADLADRGLLAGVGPITPPPERKSFAQRVFRARDYPFAWLPDYFPRAYHRWGWVFFSPWAALFLVILALAGFGTFDYLIGARYGTPFIVAHRVLIGGAVFLLGRFALVSLHEIAHGLALARSGRRAARAGLRIALIFPYAFVDTSESYFESRTRRIVVSAAGPACDLTLGALFSIACAVSPRGSVRDVCFQLTLGAYTGAFFNLNPFLERDGYHILVDVLREPRLRQRARLELSARLSGSVPVEHTSRLLSRYAMAGVIWSAVGAGFAAIFSLRYYRYLAAVAPHQLVIGTFIAFFILLLVPVVIQLGAPLLRRARFGPAEINRVIQ